MVQPTFPRSTFSTLQTLPGLMARLRGKEFIKICAISFDEFKRNEPLRLAGATAFFTTFALPPIIIILVQIIGLVFQIQNLRDRFFVRLAEVLGRQSAAQIRETFLGFTSLAKNWFLVAAGFIFLMFVATTLFKVIQDSINQLWNVKGTPQPFKLQVEKRAVSLIIILLAGILFIGGMLIEGLEAFLLRYTGEIPPRTANVLTILFNHAFSVVVVSTWFSILFKVLPAAKATWKVVVVGGIFTGVLFTIGKIIIRYMLSLGNITNIFGASGSLVLLLLFVFYSSFILYYGACFTKVYASYIDEPITPANNAIKYKMVEVKGGE
ncbi:MAG: YihY/virulence factor BrkB family protein [Segetibacter sp.]|nr:YihY/virulence factor BrkB family protein [Segetibacter sp.]